MITMSNFGENGRLGNQLFQYASLMGISIKNNVPIVLPEWRYSNVFHANFPYSGASEPYLKEEKFNYYEINEKNADLDGYFQSEKYWEHCKDIVFKQLTFKSSFRNHCKTKFSFNKDWTKTIDIDWNKTIAIHIRRGDYVRNTNYAYIPVTYYILALESQFPDWKSWNLIFFSDDIEYCKIHFSCLSNAYFANGNEIEDLCLMTECKHFIIGNSSFSWWGAYLGRKKGSKIVRPDKYFSGMLLRKNPDLSDYYPSDWITFETDLKIDLSDVTFTIPVHYDHEDRKENLQLCISYLQANFNTNIIVSEQGTDLMNLSASVNYMKLGMEVFHRTKMLNCMALEAETPIIVNQDCDVFIAPMQILEATKFLRRGVEVCYPYDGRFSGIRRQKYYQQVKIYNDIGCVKRFKAKGSMDGDKYNTVGGCVMFNKEAFIRGGMENENFISWGAEDQERWKRFNKLGFNIKRIGGSLYHMEHYVGINSSSKNPYFDMCEQEYEKVNKMNKTELETYIKTWTWTKQMNSIMK